MSMARAYSQDLRKRAVERHEAGGKSYEDVGEDFNIGRSSVNRWLRLKRETNSLEPRKAPGKVPLVSGEIEAKLRTIVDQNPSCSVPRSSRGLVSDSCSRDGDGVPRATSITVGSLI